MSHSNNSINNVVNNKKNDGEKIINNTRITESKENEELNNKENNLEKNVDKEISDINFERN